MEESAEALEKKYILLDHGVSEEKIEEVFEGYENQNLAMYGYSVTINNAIDYITRKNLKDDVAEDYLDYNMAAWSNQSFPKLLDTRRNPSALEKFCELNLVDKFKELLSRNIDQEVILYVIQGYDDPDIVKLGYREVVDKAIGHVIDMDLKGKIAEDYFKEEVAKWGEMYSENQIDLA